MATAEKLNAHRRTNLGGPVSPAGAEEKHAGGGGRGGTGRQANEWIHRYLEQAHRLVDKRRVELIAPAVLYCFAARRHVASAVRTADAVPELETTLNLIAGGWAGGGAVVGQVGVHRSSHSRRQNLSVRVLVVLQGLTKSQVCPILSSNSHSTVC